MLVALSPSKDGAAPWQMYIYLGSRIRSGRYLRRSWSGLKGSPYIVVTIVRFTGFRRLANKYWSTCCSVILCQYTPEIILNKIGWANVKIRNDGLCVVGYCPHGVLIVSFTGAYFVDVGIECFTVQIKPNCIKINDRVAYY